MEVVVVTEATKRDYEHDRATESTTNCWLATLRPRM